MWVYRCSRLRAAWGHRFYFLAATAGLLAYFLIAAAPALAAPLPATHSFQRVVIDSTVEANSHKPKVLAHFSSDGFNDLGSLDSHGFKLYRQREHWKSYVIFQPGRPGDFEDAAVADINGDGWNDIILGGWGNRTLWAENPAGKGRDPYTNSWAIHIVDTTRFSHEVCAADLNHDDHCDIVTTSGIYFQGATPDTWTFVNIGRTGQGTQTGAILNARDGYLDIVAVRQSDGTNQIAWFENPGHTGGDPIHRRWPAHVIDACPGGPKCNRDMNEMAFAVGDINGDGRLDLVAASMDEGPDPGDDNRQVGGGLVWYEAPADPRTSPWPKHIIDPTVAWVHASSIQLGDFDGTGHTSICFAEQDQSSRRKDGQASGRLGIYYNADGHGKQWRLQLLSHFPESAAGGFNSRIGVIGNDSLPSIFTSRHGYFGDANPLLVWRNNGVSH